MTLSSPSLPPEAAQRSGTARSPAPAGLPAPSTTRLLRTIVAGLRPRGEPGGASRGASRWRDRRAAWLTLPRGWTRAQVNDLVIGLPGPTPGGTALLLVVEPVRVVASGSIESDLARAAAAPGVWSPSGELPWRETVDGWTFLVAAGELALDGAVCPALTGVARRNALRTRFWALADSADTRERFRPMVIRAMTSVRDFVEGTTPRGG